MRDTMTDSMIDNIQITYHTDDQNFNYVIPNFQDETTTVEVNEDDIEEQLQDLALGAPVISKDDVTGKMTLGINIEQSSDLGNWSPIDLQGSDVSITNDKIEIDVDVATDKKFFRFSPSRQIQT